MCERNYNRAKIVDQKSRPRNSANKTSWRSFSILFKTTSNLFSCSLSGGKCAGNKPVELIARRQ